MEEADRAMLYQRLGNTPMALKHYSNAYKLESEAAYALITEYELEPTRSILFRSAATLALRAGLIPEAGRLACAGLAGNPPDEIATELRDVYDEATFNHHLDQRGVSLEDGDIQMVLAGSAVGAGMAYADIFMNKVRVAEKLIYRTVERRAKRPFKERININKMTKDTYTLFMSTPRTGSFAVTFRLGRPTQQESIFSDTATVVKELIECLTIFENEEHEELGARITNEDYRRNFVALASQLSPDGQEINLVGLTAVFDGQETRVPMRRTRKSHQKSTSNKSKKKTVELRGELQYADNTDQKRLIKIVPVGGIPVRCKVPTGMMDDVVRPLWGQMVTAYGTMRGKTLHITNIYSDS